MIYLLSPTKYYGVENLPTIEFETVTTKIDFENIDLLLFTSKQAVITVDSINKEWHKIPSIAIGSGTRDEIIKMGGTTILTSTKFYGNDLAREIIDNFSDKTILYLRPEIVSSNITEILLNANINIFEQVTYKTQCIKYDMSQKPPLNSIIIATSPSTLNCFMQNFGWCESYMVVAIGKTTAATLANNINFVISNKPTINSCIEKANELEKIRQINHH